jgi:nanoRNase/pAp phosphatase (c-di-AMP/oligoRNAs hydrolase)
LRELELVDEIKFVHPKDMQDGQIPITDRDIITNLPYVEGCHLAFDHHSSEVTRQGDRTYPNYVIEPEAPSAARVVYNYYGGATSFPRISPELMAAVDKADAAQFTREDILDPQGWELLSFLMDSRTGLGRFRDFRISNYDLMMQLIEECREHAIEDILALPDLRERVDLYRSQHDLFCEQIQRCATVYGKLVVLDLRNENVIYAGNRFTIYALYPQCSISVHILWGVKKQNTVFAIGKSILDRSSPVDVGAICLRYDGGGHRSAGTCQVPNDRAEIVKAELIAALAGVAAEPAGQHL